MADYVSREVARERLRKACKSGTIIAVILLLLGFLYAGIAAAVWFNVAIPVFLVDALRMVIPTWDESTMAVAECGTKALLFFLMGLIGILMCRKVTKTGLAFRLAQLKQLKFVSFLMILLGFLPTIVVNVLKTVLAFQAGTPLFTNLSIVTEPMCILSGLLMFMAARILVAGAALSEMEDELYASDPISSSPEPSFAGVPDLSSVPTAQPVTSTTTTDPYVSSDAAVDQTAPYSESEY